MIPMAQCCTSPSATTHTPGMAAKCAVPTNRGGKLSPRGRSAWGLTTRNTRAVDSVSAFSRRAGCMEAGALTSRTMILQLQCQMSYAPAQPCEVGSGAVACVAEAGSAG